MKISKSKWEGIFFIENGKFRPATLNLVPGFSVYGERLIKDQGKEYREWDPYRSKIGAAIMNNIKDIPIHEGDNVLYLGASTGTTASHVSDIVGKNGKVFCVDISPRTTRDLIFVCEKKKNMIPILADASKVEEYEFIVEPCDFVFEDVAAPKQISILIKNCDKFLKPKGYAMIAIKSRSIDVTKDPKEIFDEAERELNKFFEIIDKKRLEPFEEDHIIFLLRKKKN